MDFECEQQSTELLASPSALIANAKDAVNQMKACRRAERAELKEAEQAR
ncbi:MAG TPA: hypothetical protein VHV51_14085 [Polyangiaceae bacterium]|nr:hypothetical protein [Polyangiaceae bacterium]